MFAAQRALLARLRGDRRANVVVIFALTLVPVTVMAGAAVDLSRASQAKTNLQAAIDAAVLAGVKAQSGSQPSTAANAFTSNFAQAGVTLTGPTFTVNADGSLTGTATAGLATGLMALVGIKSMSFSASATAGLAAQTVTSVTFTPTFAQGTFNKKVYVFTRDATGTIVNTQLAITYSYDNSTGDKTLTPPLNEATTTITLGPYQTWGIMMQAWWQNPGTFTGASAEYYSDASNVSTFLHRTGSCAPNETDNWEDNGDSDFIDIVDSVQCLNSSGTPVTEAPYLIK